MLLAVCGTVSKEGRRLWVLETRSGSTKYAELYLFSGSRLKSFLRIGMRNSGVMTSECRVSSSCSKKERPQVDDPTAGVPTRAE